MTEFDSDMVTFDLEPYIREALDRMHIEIEHGAEEKVAAILRERGWVCTSPAKAQVAMAPTVGCRARPRWDDGVAVVREVSKDGEWVKVSYLPDPRDEETWDSGAWKRSVTDWLLATSFGFDAFPGGSPLEEGGPDA